MLDDATSTPVPRGSGTDRTPASRRLRNHRSHPHRSVAQTRCRIYASQGLPARPLAGLWLLPGSHVDDGEDPRTTVLREAAEELRIAGSPWTTPAEWAQDRFDPHRARFRDKLQVRLGTPVLVG